MSFRHDVMINGGNNEKLVLLARARNITTDDVLCEALRVAGRLADGAGDCRTGTYRQAARLYVHTNRFHPRGAALF